jgi:hypothetical protein
MSPLRLKDPRFHSTWSTKEKTRSPAVERADGKWNLGMAERETNCCFPSNIGRKQPINYTFFLYTFLYVHKLWVLLGLGWANKKFQIEFSGADS